MNSAAKFAKSLLVAACAFFMFTALAAAGDTTTSLSKTRTSATPAPRSHSAKATATHKKKKTRRASWRRGQQKVDPPRAREIQEALIREHYLKGTPSGKWDDATQSAMQRYQAANGWQTKTVPDSRALIKLGLGPNHDHLLNPESAMTTGPTPHSANTGPAEASRTPAQK